MFEKIYVLVCLIIVFITAMTFFLETAVSFVHEKWHRVGKFGSRYPKRKFKGETERKVLVTWTDGNVRETVFMFDTYRFSCGKVIAWKSYPEPCRLRKGILRTIKEKSDERKALRIRKESRNRKR